MLLQLKSLKSRDSVCVDYNICREAACVMYERRLNLCPSVCSSEPQCVERPKTNQEYDFSGNICIILFTGWLIFYQRHPGTPRVTFLSNTAWRSMLSSVFSVQRFFWGTAATWTVDLFHTNQHWLVVLEQDGLDKHSAFWAKPVWLCGLGGVTRVFPVSLHPKAFY